MELCLIWARQVRSVLFVSGAVLLLVAGCSKTGQKPVYPVKGEVFVRSQPAAGALVILHPEEVANPDEWTSGYPRGVVQPDGTFQVTTYETGDGAPAGRYVVLIEWKPSADEGADPESASPDRLGGRYMDPQKSKLNIEILPQPSQLPRFDLE